eukprot:COSAG06_NODE_63412_length_262_cov_0.822086_1_plen_34_part_10
MFVRYAKDGGRRSDCVVMKTRSVTAGDADDCLYV